MSPCVFSLLQQTRGALCSSHHEGFWYDSQNTPTRNHAWTTTSVTSTMFPCIAIIFQSGVFTHSWVLFARSFQRNILNTRTKGGIIAPCTCHCHAIHANRFCRLTILYWTLWRSPEFRLPPFGRVIRQTVSSTQSTARAKVASKRLSGNCNVWSRCLRPSMRYI